MSAVQQGPAVDRQDLRVLQHDIRKAGGPVTADKVRQLKDILQSMRGAIIPNPSCRADTEAEAEVLRLVGEAEKLLKEEGKPTSPFCAGCNDPNCKDCFYYD
jgi:hypothetical protein